MLAQCLKSRLHAPRFLCLLALAITLYNLYLSSLNYAYVRKLQCLEEYIDGLEFPYSAAHQRPTIAGTNTNDIRQIIRPELSSYLFNPVEKCAKGVDVIFISFSNPSDLHIRNEIREKWTRNQTLRVAHVFFLGSTKNMTASKDIEDEFFKYNDIVQDDFIDTYKNLTLKSMSVLKWVSSYCPNVTFTVKHDTDTQVEVDKLVQALYRQHRRHKSFIIGNLDKKAKPIRSGSKWSVSCETYPSSRYPAYIHGPTYGLTTNLASRLLHACLDLPYFELEDIFVTGVCARQINALQITDTLFTYKYPDV